MGDCPSELHEWSAHWSQWSEPGYSCQQWAVHRFPNFAACISGWSVHILTWVERCMHSSPAGLQLGHRYCDPWSPFSPLPSCSLHCLLPEVAHQICLCHTARAVTGCHCCVFVLVVVVGIWEMRKSAWVFVTINSLCYIPTVSQVLRIQRFTNKSHFLNMKFHTVL